MRRSLAAIVVSLGVLVQPSFSQAAEDAPNAETQRVPRNYDVESYRTELALDPKSTDETFTAETEIFFKAGDAMERIEFDALELTAESAVMTKPTKKDLTVKSNGTTMTVEFPGRMRKGDRWAIQIRYKGKINTAHQGLFRVWREDGTTKEPLLVTQGEAQSARRFFPCNDHPADKATSTIVISVPNGLSAIANGDLANTTKDKKRPGYTRFEWRLDKKHSPYLTSLAVGRYEKSSRKVDGREIALWTAPGQAARGALALDAAEKSLAYFEKELGVKYPWNRYGIVTVPTFQWGGMENTTSTHQNEERTLVTDPRSSSERRNIVELTAHELAHQWFGDFATLQWWDDLWLNESFADLMGTDATKAFFRTDEAELRSVASLWDWYFRQEKGPRSRPLVAKSLPSIDEAFDAISYTKGEFVLRTLRTHVGASRFRAGLKRYLETHAYGNATYRDFFTAVEKSSGEKLDAFRDAWLLQRGYPVVTYRWTHDANNKELVLEVEQTPLHADATQPFRFRLPVVAQRQSEPKYELRRMVDVSAKKTTVRMPAPAAPDWVTVNEGFATLVDVGLTEQLRPLLPRIAKDDPDAFTRLWAAYALSAQMVSGQEADVAGRALAAVIKTDKSPYVRTIVLDQLEDAPPKAVSREYAKAILEEAKRQTDGRWLQSEEAKQDLHGWTGYRAALLRALGRLDDDGAFALLKAELERADVPLDELSASSIAMARMGRSDSGKLLDQALERHGKRGYRYRYVTSVAFGALEDARGATSRIESYAKTATPDWLGGVGRMVRDNHALRGSAAWTNFLEKFLREEGRYGDEVKARLLSTVEEEKAEPVNRMLGSLAKDGPSERIRDLARRIREKSFASGT